MTAATPSATGYWRAASARTTAAPAAADLDQDALTIKGAAYDAADFRAGEWRDDLDADHAALQAIYESVKDLTPADDAKLHAVASFAATPGVNAEKLLIFTESTVTARYLYDELSQNYDAGAVDILAGAVDILAGEDAKGVDKMTRFAPASNEPPDLPAEQQIRILIATDVLSEGQNRQDCGRALNYDLHWNPVTLIQRCGRVDGITTEHAVIHRHNAARCRRRSANQPHRTVERPRPVLARPDWPGRRRLAADGTGQLGQHLRYLRRRAAGTG